MRKTTKEMLWDKFLENVANTSNVRLSAQAANLSVNEVKSRVEKDLEFRKRYEFARKQAVEALEDEAFRRAHPHERIKITAKGDVVPYSHPGSDVLTIFLLKGGMPDKYAERSNINTRDLTLEDLVGNPKEDTKDAE